MGRKVSRVTGEHLSLMYSCYPSVVGEHNAPVAYGCELRLHTLAAVESTGNSRGV